MTLLEIRKPTANELEFAKKRKRISKYAAITRTILEDGHTALDLSGKRSERRNLVTKIVLAVSQAVKRENPEKSISVSWLPEDVGNDKKGTAILSLSNRKPRENKVK